jgi:hypothetical protein
VIRHCLVGDKAPGTDSLRSRSPGACPYRLALDLLGRDLLMTSAGGWVPRSITSPRHSARSPITQGYVENLAQLRSEIERAFKRLNTEVC